MSTLLAALLLAAADRGEIELARKALAKELAVPAATLRLVSSENVPRAGCPGAGAGSRSRDVELEAAGGRYLVNVSKGRAMVCVRPSAPKATVSARADLAARLGVGAGEIQTLQVKPVVWPDASLGCPADGMMYAQVQTDGYLIELAARGRKWTYHADRARAVLCEDGAARK